MPKIPTLGSSGHRVLSAQTTSAIHLHVVNLRFFCFCLSLAFLSLPSFSITSSGRLRLKKRVKGRFSRHFGFFASVRLASYMHLPMISSNSLFTSADVASAASIQSIESDAEARSYSDIVPEQVEILD